MYEVSLTATNGIPAYDVTDEDTPAEVLEWICNPPWLQLPADFTDEDTMLEIKKSNNRTVSTSSLRLFCMKSRIVSYRWSILDSQLTALS